MWEDFSKLTKVQIDWQPDMIHEVCLERTKEILQVAQSIIKKYEFGTYCWKHKWDGIFSYLFPLNPTAGNDSQVFVF